MSFPILRTWARIVPQVKIFGVSINPGPFTIKEHVLITIMASVGAGSAYAVSIFLLRPTSSASNHGLYQTDIVAVQKVYYNQSPPFAYQWFLVMSTQLVSHHAGPPHGKVRSLPFSRL